MLVGRESERRALAEVLAAARVGDSRAVVLTGDPGIGKSALLADAESMVGDMRVLRAQGVESEQAVPFAGLLQVLRPLLGDLAGIPLPQRRALATAFLLDPDVDAEPTRFAVGAATLSLLSRAAEDGPIAIVVDDAHLLDSPSSDALVFAARRLLTDPVALLVALRPDEPGATAWLGLPTLTLGGLDLDEASELLSGPAGPPRDDTLLALHRVTAGNPLGLLELSESADGSDIDTAQPVRALSDQLQAAFLGRAAELDPEERTALLVVATDGASTATLAAVCARLGSRRPDLAHAESLGLLSIRGDRVEFRHPLVRSAVYGAAAPEERRAVHRAFADVVPAHQTDRLAWHLAASAVAPDDETATVLEAVAGQAASRGAYATAANAHERSAELTSSPRRQAQRWASAGEAAWMAGASERAVELLDRAADASADSLLLAHVHELRGAIQTRSGSLEEALTTLMDAAAEVEPEDPGLAIRLLADAVHVSFYLADSQAATTAGAGIDRLLDDTVDAQTRALGSMAAGMALVLQGQGTRGLDRMRRAAYPLVTTESVPDGFRLPLRVQGALWLRGAGTDLAAVHEAIDRMRADAALGSLPYLLMHLARDAATTDRWDDAEAAYVEGIRLAGETGQSTDLAASLAGLACLHARQGRAAECAADIEAASELCERNRIRLGSLWLRYARGDLAAGAGDMVEAAAQYQGLCDELDRLGFGDPDQSCAPELTDAYAHLGRLDEARAVAEAFARSAAAKGHPWSLARAERGLGLCTSGAEAEQHFRRAQEHHSRTHDLYEMARTDLAFGAALRRDRRRVEARPLLRSAVASFERLGAAPWADIAARELAAAGESAARRSADPADQLTPQERQIARLLAQGRTTREAAAALFLSPKTVEYHLRHVYLKLGIRSRGELAEALGS